MCLSVTLSKMELLQTRGGGEREEREERGGERGGRGEVSKNLLRMRVSFQVSLILKLLPILYYCFIRLELHEAQISGKLQVCSSGEAGTDGKDYYVWLHP